MAEVPAPSQDDVLKRKEELQVCVSRCFQSLDLTRSSQRLEMLIAERKKQLADLETQMARQRVAQGASEQTTPEKPGHRKKPSVSLAATSPYFKP